MANGCEVQALSARNPPDDDGSVSRVPRRQVVLEDDVVHLGMRCGPVTLGPSARPAGLEPVTGSTGSQRDVRRVALDRVREEIPVLGEPRDRRLVAQQTKAVQHPRVRCSITRVRGRQSGDQRARKGPGDGLPVRHDVGGPIERLARRAVIEVAVAFAVVPVAVVTAVTVDEAAVSTEPRCTVSLGHGLAVAENLIKTRV